MWQSDWSCFFHSKLTFCPMSPRWNLSFRAFYAPSQSLPARSLPTVCCTAVIHCGGWRRTDTLSPGLRFIFRIINISINNAYESRDLPGWSWFVSHQAVSPSEGDTETHTPMCKGNLEYWIHSHVFGLENLERNHPCTRERAKAMQKNPIQTKELPAAPQHCHRLQRLLQPIMVIKLPCCLLKLIASSRPTIPPTCALKKLGYYLKTSLLSLQWCWDPDIKDWTAYRE